MTDHQRRSWRHGRFEVVQRFARYYIALRMSAAVAVPEHMDLEGFRDPAPIVRLAPARVDDWDELESLDLAGRRAIITVPLSAVNGRRGMTISLN